MNQSDTEKVLIISPHPDDGILGMGGTIARFVEEGKEVIYTIFSWEDQGFRGQEEIINSLSKLGIKEKNIEFFDYQVRNFPYLAGEIREEMIKMREELEPDIVFVHNSFDFHQDHSVASQEAVRAFREGIILGYILPWNLRKIRFDTFYELEERHLEKKLEAIKVLTSQKHRFYYNPDKLKALAEAIGLFRRKNLAEAFELLSEVK